MAFRKARKSRIGGKFLAYGDTGSGKSFFGLTFPNSAVVDSEVGIAHYEGVDITLNNGNTYNNVRLVDNTSSLDDLSDNLDDFLNGDYDGEIESFIIDSETKFYATMQVGAQEVEERRARRKGGDVDDANISQRSWGRIKIRNLDLQQAKIDLSARGIHIVSIAQATDERDKNGEKIIGIKPDMHKSVKFDYDIILEFFTKEEKDGIHYYAKVIKDRTNVFKRGDIIENPCYDLWKPYFDARNGLETNKTSYKNDVKTSTQNMMAEADRADELVEEFKELMGQVGKDANKAKAIAGKAKELGVDLKALNLETPEKLTELVEFVKVLLEA